MLESVCDLVIEHRYVALLSLVVVQALVTRSTNQLHDVKNVFVTDGAAMTSSACQNPSLTYMAFTARACATAVDQMNRGEL